MPPSRPKAWCQAAVSKRSWLTGRCVDALLWNFPVLGEAAAQLPEEFKKAHPGVNWTRPSQLRNRIVHGYWSIDLEILHTTASHDLSTFVAQLKVVLATIES